MNIADTYRLNILSTLVVLSKFSNHKPFIDMTEEDILLYLDSLRKPDSSDPLHKWIGTYNEKRIRKFRRIVMAKTIYVSLFYDSRRAQLQIP